MDQLMMEAARKETFERPKRMMQAAIEMAMSERRKNGEPDDREINMKEKPSGVFPPYEQVKLMAMSGNIPADVMNQELFRAAAHNEHQILLLFLENGANASHAMSMPDPTKPGGLASSPVLLMGASKGYVKIVEALLNHGAAVDQPDHFG